MAHCCGGSYTLTAPVVDDTASYQTEMQLGNASHRPTVRFLKSNSTIPDECCLPATDCVLETVRTRPADAARASNLQTR